jgi:hypothetical protein
MLNSSVAGNKKEMFVALLAKRTKTKGTKNNNCDIIPKLYLSFEKDGLVSERFKKFQVFE